MKIANKFKFMSKSLYLEVKVSKRAKKCQKMLKTATNWTYNAYSEFFLS